MVRAANELGVAVIVTEQYPKGLGHTVAELDLSGALCVPKTDFSMIVPDVSARLSELQVSDAVIVGLEAHVCVQQTTLDLLAMDVNVHLCVDAISSQCAAPPRSIPRSLPTTSRRVTTVPTCM